MSCREGMNEQSSGTEGHTCETDASSQCRVCVWQFLRCPRFDGACRRLTIQWKFPKVIPTDRGKNFCTFGRDRKVEKGPLSNLVPLFTAQYWSLIDLISTWKVPREILGPSWQKDLASGNVDEGPNDSTVEGLRIHLNWYCRRDGCHVPSKTTSRSR